VDYETNNRNNEIGITITLDCEIISGDNEEDVFGTDFVVYEDGKLIGPGAHSLVTIYPGRGPVEMSIHQYSSASASRIEVDYRDDDYTREWGKLTFVVDLP
jgi:hypothetical protein